MAEEHQRVTKVRRLVESESRHGHPARSAGPVVAMQRLCSTLVREVPASGAGVSLAAGDAHAVVVAAAGSFAEEAEELQLTLGEGPSCDAIRHRRPVLSADLVGAGTRLWPTFAPAAAELGVRGVFAFPLQIGAACLGVLDVYQDQPGGLPPDALFDALAFAEVALTLLLDDQREGQPAEELVGLDDGPTPPALYQAQGMVMIQLGVGLAEAMVRIRAHAYRHDRRLRDIAHDITAGRLSFTGDEL